MTFTELHDSLTDPDDRVALAERAAIIEIDGKLPRDEAEALAVADWIKAHDATQEKTG